MFQGGIVAVWAFKNVRTGETEYCEGIPDTMARSRHGELYWGYQAFGEYLSIKMKEDLEGTISDEEAIAQMIEISREKILRNIRRWEMTGARR